MINESPDAAGSTAEAREHAAHTHTAEWPKAVEADALRTEYRIRLRAYHIWLERDGEHGRDVEDWLQAETEICLQAEKIRGEQ